MFLVFEFCCRTPPSCLKVRGWWHSRLYGGGTAGYMVVAYSILVSAPVPFGFRSYWDLVGVGPRGSWDSGFGDRA